MGRRQQAKHGERAAHVIDGGIPVLSVFEKGGRVVVDVTRDPVAGERVLVEREGRKMMALHPCEGKLLGTFLVYQVPRVAGDR